MASDLISRAAVLNGISDLMKSPWYIDGKSGERHLQYLARKDAVEVVKVLCIEKAPVVDAVPVVHARWILIQNGSGICSACNRNDHIDSLAAYCRYCGAKMDGE